MKYLPYLLIMLVVALWLPSWAQDVHDTTGAAVAVAQTVAPLPPAPLPESKKGWFDFIAKRLPHYLGGALPILLLVLNATGKTFIAKIPRDWMLVISPLLTAILSLIDSGVSAQVLDGAGGIAPGPAALSGATQALLTQGIANKGLDVYHEHQLKKATS